MPAFSVRVNSKNQITIPKAARRKLNIKTGDQLLMDIQENVIMLLTKPTIDTKYLRGLNSEIWKNIDTDRYLSNERTNW